MGASTRPVSCTGSTPSARLARAVAARLARDEPLAALDVEAIAVDGCPSACASRKLAAQGIDALSVQLQEVGVDPGRDLAHADEIAARASLLLRRRHASKRSARHTRTHRPERPRAADPATEHRSHTRDDYLYALYRLTSPIVSCGARATDLPTLAAHVARALSVSRPSAGAMVGRLEEDGLVERGPAREILLTAAGRRAAAAVVRRHRLIERFLTNALGYAPAESHELAMQVREGFGETLTGRIAANLPPEARCPHGWPIDAVDELEQLGELVLLSTLAAGERATVVALAEDDVPALEHIAELGLRPGDELAVQEAGTRGTTLVANGATLLVDTPTCSAVFVRPRCR